LHPDASREQYFPFFANLRARSGTAFSHGLDLFLPLMKVDLDRRLVTGVATVASGRLLLEIGLARAHSAAPGAQAWAFIGPALTLWASIFGRSLVIHSASFKPTGFVFRSSFLASISFGRRRLVRHTRR
jgi:hypothetical protein